MSKIKLITLYEIRRDNVTRPSESIGRRRLRDRSRATKLCRYLRKRYGTKTVLHSWKVNAATVGA